MITMGGPRRSLVPREQWGCAEFYRSIDLRPVTPFPSAPETETLAHDRVVEQMGRPRTQRRDVRFDIA